MPGVHPGRVCAQAPGLAPFGRDDVELAVRHQQHVVLGLAEDDPLPVRGELREVVALPVVRGALDRLGLSASAVVERNPVQIELERLLVLDELGDVLLAQQDARRVRDRVLPVRLRPGEDDRLSVGAPGRVALHVLGVVGARQRLEGAGLGVVDDENALDREEELRIPDVGRRHEHRAVLDRADHVAAVGRDLGEEPERGLAVAFLVVAPGDDLLVVQHHLRGHREDRVGALVVAVIDVEAQHAAVARERVAIPADRQVLEDDGRRGLGVDRPEAPADARRILDGRDERQRNLAIEDRVAHRVRRGPDADARGRDGLRVRAEADDRHLRVPFHAALLDRGPIGLRGTPAGLRRREPEHLAVVVESKQDRPVADALGLVAPDEGRGDDLGREQRLVERILDLDATGGLARERERCRCGFLVAGAEGQRCDEQQAPVQIIELHLRAIVGGWSRRRQTMVREPAIYHKPEKLTPVFHKSKNRGVGEFSLRHWA